MTVAREISSLSDWHPTLFSTVPVRIVVTNNLYRRNLNAQNRFMRANSSTLFKPAFQKNYANSLFRNILPITLLYARICGQTCRSARLTTNKINNLLEGMKKNRNQIPTSPVWFMSNWLYCWLLMRAPSNSSPFCQPINLGRLAASHPRAKPKRAIAESPTKSISGWYSSLGW